MGLLVDFIDRFLEADFEIVVVEPGFSTSTGDAEPAKSSRKARCRSLGHNTILDVVIPAVGEECPSLII